VTEITCHRESFPVNVESVLALAPVAGCGQTGNATAESQPQKFQNFFEVFPFFGLCISEGEISDWFSDRKWHAP
jgi:hypothetical protein